MKFIYLIFVIFSLISQSALASDGNAYAFFIQKHLSKENTKSHLLIIKPELKEKIVAILGHAYPALRIRYWEDGESTLWILDEIGKSLPITTGVVIRNGKIIDLEVLAFRESRGFEVKYPQFTKQFSGLTLEENNSLSLEADNITGATLSVIAVNKIARLALFLDQEIKLIPAD